MYASLNDVQARYEEITRLLSEPGAASDQTRFRDLSREHAQLTPLMEAFQAYRKVETELTQQSAMAQDPAEDPELRAMAQQEIPQLKAQLEELSQTVKLLLLPKDPLDNSNVVLEIRAGTGGDEASLFAAELYRMYTRFAATKGWTSELLSASPSESGGFKEVVASLEGNEVFRLMKFESGVHRVQRVPATENQGRIHTSTATVAVLPEATEVEVNFQPSDLRIDVFRSSGPGGQSVNTTDSAVRVTHLPTGTVAQCQDEKSQHKNKEKALKMLRARIYEKMLAEQQKKEADQRRGMIGTGDRSERIRTYNFPQGRLTDHRINLTLYKLDKVMEGDIEEMIEGLLAHDQTERLKAGETKAGVSGKKAG
ncbi:MAG: peptide chain release factor 1 [Deltaproteobacteria bacterium]|nr:peptide chain release factor 1 [Deltaproteobacteria bacterium]